jgi:hypothetical protein
MPKARKEPAQGAPDEPKASANNVSFRLGVADLEVLAAVATAQSTSPGLLAKQWVLDRLENPQSSSSQQAADVEAIIQTVHTHLVEVRRELAISVESILVASGRVSKEEARKWVDDQIRHKKHVVNQQSDQSGKLP